MTLIIVFRTDLITSLSTEAIWNSPCFTYNKKILKKKYSIEYFGPEFKTKVFNHQYKIHGNPIVKIHFSLKPLKIIKKIIKLENFKLDIFISWHPSMKYFLIKTIVEMKAEITLQIFDKVIFIFGIKIKKECDVISDEI